MDLSVHELEETLLTVTQWELSGKDIFDLDFDVVDPIEVVFTPCELLNKFEQKRYVQ